MVESDTEGIVLSQAQAEYLPHEARAKVEKVLEDFREEVAFEE